MIGQRNPQPIPIFTPINDNFVSQSSTLFSESPLLHNSYRLIVLKPTSESLSSPQSGILLLLFQGYSSENVIRLKTSFAFSKIEANECCDWIGCSFPRLKLTSATIGCILVNKKSFIQKLKRNGALPIQSCALSPIINICPPTVQ